MDSASDVSSSKPELPDSRPLHLDREGVIPPPCYSGNYGEMDLNQRGFGTNACVARDGRIDINIHEKGQRLSTILRKALRPSEGKPLYLAPVPESLKGDKGKIPAPRLNVVIQIVGSRGDVQPFVALGKLLKEEYGHRVRLATHSTFQSFVESHGLEFFSIGGDPAQLMAFMVRNPGLMPGIETFRSGDIGKRRKEIAEIISGCWRSCFEPGGTGETGTHLREDGKYDCSSEPFIAEAIIANPPSFAHIHCAEKLGIPLHLMFTMPWSPTELFPHPLVNIQSSNADTRVANFVSYALVEMLTWQGLGDIINGFREHTLGLEPISVMWGPGMIPRLRIPYTYCWSPGLLPKPKDWGSHIDICGFYFLAEESNYTPPDDLAAFLADGPPPVYIGFGSIVIDDPDQMTQLVFDAVRRTGQRALVSKGWGGFGAEEMGIPDGVFMVGNCPHDWLFKRVSCVVHHGGAGTTAAGILSGKPTVIIPFFGDQPFWGSIVEKAGAGPTPIRHKELTAENLAAAITSALEPETIQNVEKLGKAMEEEMGIEMGARCFHKHLDTDSLRCVLAPERVAVWRIKRTRIRLSSFAAATLSNEGILGLGDLKLYRPREYNTEPGPRDPLTGGASALIESIGDFAIGIADFPAEIIRAALQSRSTDKPSKFGSHDKSSGRLPLHNGSPTQSSDSVGSVDHQIPASSTSELGSIAEGESVDDSASIASTVDSSSSKTKKRDFRPHEITAETAISAGHAASKLVSVGLKSPMHFALGLAKGFHNAPKLYGDKSVRDFGKVTGFQSGLRVAGKEFGYGFYDGISGLVTQPLDGLKEGPAGVVKGIGKGIGGLILKPGAGIFGLPGYTLNGVYKEVRKVFGTNVTSYMIACRSKQGCIEWCQATQEEKDNIIRSWHSLGADLQSKAAQSPFAAEWEAVAEVLFKSKKQQRDTTPQQADPTAIDKLAPKNFSESVRTATHLLSHIIKQYKFDKPTFEKTPHGSTESLSSEESGDDEMIQRAVQASVAEAHEADACGDQQNASNRAAQACVNEIERSISREPDRKNPVSHHGRHFLKKNEKKEEPSLEHISKGSHERIPIKDGLEAITEYAIWRTLTDQSRSEHHEVVERSVS